MQTLPVFQTEWQVERKTLEQSLLHLTGKVKAALAPREERRGDQEREKEQLEVAEAKEPDKIAQRTTLEAQMLSLGRGLQDHLVQPGCVYRPPRELSSMLL